MKTFLDKKNAAEQVEKLKELVGPGVADKIIDVTNRQDADYNNDTMIPVPFRMLQKISRENRMLRKYLLNYCRNNKILGYENYGKDLPIDFNNQQAYNSRGQVIAKLTPEQIEKNKNEDEKLQQELASPVKQYSLDELILLKEAAKAEDAKARDDRAKGLK